jgi:hypothetical protein
MANHEKHGKTDGGENGSNIKKFGEFHIAKTVLEISGGIIAELSCPPNSILGLCVRFLLLP